MEFGVLGPLLVRTADGLVTVPGPKQRALLGMLLLHANQTVPGDLLAEAVWDGRPPLGAAEILPSYVMRLRRSLGVEVGARVVTRSGGYAVEAEAAELDLSRFRAAYTRARELAEAADWTTTADLLTNALTLWRGEPLADVPVQNVLRDELRELTELRLRAQRQRVDADLELGRHHEVIPELQRAIAAHPLHEPLRGQLMLALYRAGRQAEALDVYLSVRQTLADELGIDPMPPLQDLHQRILNADPTLMAAASDRPMARPAARAVPRQLPVAVRHFAGRAEHIKALTELVDDGASTNMVVISAIDGTAGIGKTALAIHWAHQVAHLFPDGQLYVNLRGFDPTGAPMNPAEAIRGFLDAFGVAPHRIPAGLDDQAALYRSYLADRRVLAVLDNARDADHVRPLLPGSSGCLVLVTSRNRLFSLVAAEGARPLTLDLLTATEARDLLARRLGVETTLRQPRAVDQLIDLCARLPLALNIAAAHAAVNPTQPLADLVARLRDIRGRLDVLDGGDQTTDVRAVFSWSYQQLSAPAGRVFRLIGLPPGPDITPPAIASLAGVTLAEAEQTLHELARAHLLTEHTTGRYVLHDLLRAYAAEQVQARDTPDERHQATRRLLDHYLHTAHAAALLLQPDRIPVVSGPPAAGTTPEQLADHDDAMTWFITEHQVMMAAITWAADTGFDRQARQLAWTMAHYFDRLGHWHDYAASQLTALAAVERLDDLTAQAGVHRSLGWAYTQLGSFPVGEDHFDRSIDLYRRLGDTIGLGYTLLAAARLFGIQHRYERGLEDSQEALQLFREADYPSGLAEALNSVGWYLTLLGDHEEALTYCQQGLDLQREVGNKPGEASTLDSLGFAYHNLGRYSEAVARYEDALILTRELRTRELEADVLEHLGDTRLAMGDTGAARDTWQRARAIFEDLSHPSADPVRAKLDQLD
jgi:DNA-binding SARP family transcriptional activator